MEFSNGEKKERNKKEQQFKNTTEQKELVEGERTAQNDGFRYDYDDSSDIK